MSYYEIEINQIPRPSKLKFIKYDPAIASYTVEYNRPLLSGWMNNFRQGLLNIAEARGMSLAKLSAYYSPTGSQTYFANYFDRAEATNIRVPEYESIKKFNTFLNHFGFILDVNTGYVYHLSEESEHLVPQQELKLEY